MTDQQTVQAKLIEVRAKLRISRRQLAEETGLTESVVWRIEKKGSASDAERTALEPVLTRYLESAGSVRAGAGRANDGGHGGDSTSTTAGRTAGLGTSHPAGATDGVRGTTSSGSFGAADPSAAYQVEGGGTAAQPPAEPAEPAASTVDWRGLQAVAGAVSEHDLERGLLTGPDRSLGFRLFSNSELQTFKSCRRRWWLGWYRQLRLKYESPVGPLAIGDRVHRALRLYYVPAGLPRVDPRTALERLIVEDWTAISAALTNQPEKLAILEKKFNDEANLERIMIAGYVDWVAETGADAEFDVIASERYMEADVTADLREVMPMASNFKGIKVIGKLDVRVKRRRDGVRLFIDHKSLAEFTTVRQVLPLDEQMIHYHLLEWLASGEGEERCDGALYNMLRKVKRTGSARPPFYDRVEVHHNRHTIEAYKRRMLATIIDVLEVEDLLNHGTEHFDAAYPSPSRDCRWKCPFFAVCPMFDDGSRAEDMLKQYYVEGDPLSYYNTGMSEGEE